jgi:hypothetical protein
MVQPEAEFAKERTASGGHPWAAKVSAPTRRLDTATIAARATSPDLSMTVMAS